MNGEQSTELLNIFGKVVDEDPSDNPLFGSNPPDSYFCFLNGSDLIFASNFSDDIYAAAGGDELYGRSGNDRLNGGAGDQIDGGSGNDDIRAQQDDDSVFGGDGNDSIRGGVGDDDLGGGLGRDTIRGQNGNDYINGNEDNDDLRGGDGIDELEGGFGADVMLGGGDKDYFDYGATTESGTTATTRDTINGFQHGADIFDIGDIDARANTADDDAFVFRESGVINGVGQIRAVDAAGGCVLEFNTKGTIAAEMTIFVAGGSAADFSGADFFL